MSRPDTEIDIQHYPLRITRLGALPRYQVTVVDARGHGYGAIVWGHGRAERLADQLAERIQAEQNGEVTSPIG